MNSRFASVAPLAMFVAIATDARSQTLEVSSPTASTRIESGKSFTFTGTLRWTGTAPHGVKVTYGGVTMHAKIDPKSPATWSVGPFTAPTVTADTAAISEVVATSDPTEAPVPGTRRTVAFIVAAPPARPEALRASNRPPSRPGVEAGR